MKNMLETIVPKSDQMNGDDLIGRSITIKITNVSLAVSEQPVSISYEGDNGKPYKPGKSMRRVLVSVWGPDGNAYVGRSMTLYRDDKVVFGGLAVGGIRISHMSDMANNKPVTLVLTASKANKKPFTVNPLAVEVPDPLRAVGISEAEKGSAALKTWWSSIGGANHKRLGVAYLDELKAIAAKADWSAEDGTPDEAVTLTDRVNSMVANIEMDKECVGTDDYQNVTETKEFIDLWAEIKASGKKDLLGKISAAISTQVA